MIYAMMLAIWIFSFNLYFIALFFLGYRIGAWLVEKRKTKK